MSLTTLVQALKAPKNQYNSFGKYNYRSCEDIMEAVKPLLEKHNATLTLDSSLTEISGHPVIEATAKYIDKDGSYEVKAYAGVDINKKSMDISQSYGSSTTYARKYALAGLFLLDDTKDSDATNTHGEKPETNKPQEFNATNTIWLTDQQYQELVKMIEAGENIPGVKAIIAKFSGTVVDGLKYQMKNTYRQGLNRLLDN